MSKPIQRNAPKAGAAPFSIVETDESHGEGFHEALSVLCREKKFLAATEPPPPEDTRKFLRGMIQKKNPSFVALDGAKVVGWCDISRGVGTHAHVGVLGMGLLPDYRHRGIGTELLKKTLETAFARGFTRIELTVREQNKNAIALYKKNGFEIEGLKRESHKIEGVLENSYLMSRLASDKAP